MARDEINAAGGIMVGEDSYQITLVDADSNEILSTEDAVTAMENLITVQNVDFVVGGFRSEAALAMQEKAAEHAMIFIGCGASENLMTARVAEDYDKYKGFFRVTPVNGSSLARISFLITGMVVKDIAMRGVAPKIAIFAEDALWVDTLLAAAVPFFTGPPEAGGMGVEIVGTWRASQTDTDVSAALNAIEAAGANIIYTVVSGPLGVAYTSQWGELQIPAASVGINVEAQKGNFLEVTGGFGAYETTLNTYAPVASSPTTITFYDAFVDKFDTIPVYTAGTYDAILILKDAIERAGSLDADDVIAALEATDMVGPAGRAVFSATDTAQPHDITWGPGFVTGVGVQWQDGELKCVWPDAGGTLDPLVYEGTVPYQLPPWVATALSQ
jgi:branched-chain amino acid transport system substrate-binding protein